MSHVIVVVHALGPSLEIKDQLGLVKGRLFVILWKEGLKTEFFLMEDFDFSLFGSIRLLMRSFLGTFAWAFVVKNLHLSLDFGLIVSEGLFVRSEPHGMGLHSLGSFLEVELQLGLVDLRLSVVLGKGVVEGERFLVEDLMLFFLH